MSINSNLMLLRIAHVKTNRCKKNNKENKTVFEITASLKDIRQSVSEIISRPRYDIISLYGLSCDLKNKIDWMIHLFALVICPLSSTHVCYLSFERTNILYI